MKLNPEKFRDHMLTMACDLAAQAEIPGVVREERTAFKSAALMVSAIAVSITAAIEYDKRGLN